MAPPIKPVPSSIVRDYLAGATIDEIAFAAGTNYARIRRGLLRRGIELRSRGTRQRPAIERFDALYSPEPNTGCWIWAGCWGPDNGYGYIVTGSSRDGSREIVLAHRFSFEFHNGPIPDGLHIDHLCRMRLCVNPAHLEAVTQAENNRRMREALSWAA